MSSLNYFDIIEGNQSRIFQLDSDCYLIYIGSRFDESRPFIRIGASRNVDKKMFDQVQYLFLTPSLLQNFTYEVNCVNVKSPDKLTLIGSQKQIDLYFSLCDKLSIPRSKFDTVILKTKQGKNKSEYTLFVERIEYNVSSERIAKIGGSDFEKQYCRNIANKIEKKVKLKFIGDEYFELLIGDEKIIDLNKFRSNEYSSENYFSKLKKKLCLS